ncbi:hypothetical protein BIZ83_gp273 [Erwinia phage vB_EamM_ChrisDB]|uniref:hypothetical protein n=1 Tax=Erwinia phage vB_EamM_ChrisDB TaxID=1883371 RepID=UPI00081CF0F1|nr:hypothetical protein BIZ83_gp273 [Erwinia phage vB_EamM_ChrisDB]ANZ48580.1 hypothetical protein CHRISDB_9 [Erwinia phage vB_EamM_ChrisDB]
MREPLYMQGLKELVREFIRSLKSVWSFVRHWSLAHYWLTGGGSSREGSRYRHLPAWKYVSVTDRPAPDC